MSKPTLVEKALNAAGNAAVNTTNRLIGTEEKPGVIDRWKMAYTLGTEGRRFPKKEKAKQSTTDMQQAYINENGMY